MTIITKIINHLSVHKTLDDYIFDDIHITKSFYDAIYLLGFDIMVKNFKFLIENKLDKIINLVMLIGVDYQNMKQIEQM